MSKTPESVDGPGPRPRTTSTMGSVRAAYDAVAKSYADALMDELDDRPIERGLLRCLMEHCSPRKGPVADVGCGPGHVTRHLARLGLDVIGVDLAPRMIEEARRRCPDLDFRVGSMTDLDAPDAGWSGVVALYSIIHLEDADRRAALREFARVLEPGGLLLLSFHVSTAEQRCGSTIHVENMFGVPVDLEGYFLAPDVVVAELEESGFSILVRLEREPLSADEYPSRRCYLLARSSEAKGGS